MSMSEYEAIVKENDDLKAALAAEKEFSSMLVNRLGDRTVDLKRAIRQIAILQGQVDTAQNK